MDAPYPTPIQRVQAMPYGLRGFRAFCRVLGLKIHAYQAFMLAFYFAGVTELVIVIPKKNGKTTLLAALALYHLLMTPKAECVIGAASRDQASILFAQAAQLVRDAQLERRMLPRKDHGEGTYVGVFEILRGYRAIRVGQGRIRVLAADADKADGVIPTLALVDELHRHPSGDLYGVFRDGLLGNAQMITISTAGATLDSALGHLMTKAREFALEQVKRRRTYTSPDGSFVLVEWALEADDDFHHMPTVKLANPAPWHTTKTLRRRHDSPSTSPGQWLRFACGIWTFGDEPAILPVDWDRLRVDIGQVSPGDEVVLVPSIGSNAAIGIASLRSDGRVAVAAEVIPPVEGSIYVEVEDRLDSLAEQYRVRAIHHPLGGFTRSAELLEGRGLPMVEAPHSPARGQAACGTFDRLMRAGLLMHDGDPILRQHVLSATLKTTETGERYEITDEARALIAVTYAVHAVTAEQPAPRAVGVAWA